MLNKSNHSKPMLRLRFQAAALFNCMFAVLATVTLLGIVFLTRPKQPMHNVPPSWWIPISCIFIPGLVATQSLTWRTFRNGKTLSPLEIVKTHRSPPASIRPLLSCFWFSNYVITFVILISLYKPDQNRGFETSSLLLATIISSFISTTANTFLLLFTRSISDSDELIQRVWLGRHAFTLAVAAVGILYYYVLNQQ